MISIRLALVVLFLLATFAAVAQETEKPAQGWPGETKEQRDARMKWWRKARFGMFIHWGIYSVPAGTYEGKQIGGIGEWIMNSAQIPVAEYAKYAGQFNPVKFNADEWVRLAKNAGMKYIVITSKHHDGFAMFCSKASSYNICDVTPYKHDPLKDLAAACAKQGIKLGFYYSQAQDWNHAGGAAMRRNNRATDHWDKAQDGDFDQYLKTIALPQVREILTNYGPVAVLWFDTPTSGMTKENAQPFVDLLKEVQPQIVWNNRLGGGFAGDTETPEQYVPATGYPGGDWETCMTMNDTWGFKSYDDKWKSTEALLHNLIDIASKGGNYLLNVGPTSEGVIPQPSVERLGQIGQWMKTNGDAIYGTTASPLKRYSFDGRCTAKGDKLYVHVFHWPSEGVKLTGLKSQVKSGRLIDGGEEPKIETSDVVTIKPPSKQDPIATVVELQLDGPPQVDPAAFAVAPDGEGVLHLGAMDAMVQGRKVKLQNEDTNDGPNIGFWTDRRDFVLWDAMVRKAGQYTVELIHSCADENAGAEVELSIVDKPAAAKVTTKIAGTGGWDKYKTEKVGTIDLPQGATTLQLKPTTVPSKGVMNLREVRLTPASAAAAK